jgi:hypothetical protein
MNELVPARPGRGPDVNDTLALAEVTAKSGFFADARDAAQAAVKILAGREMGFGPFQSMVGIHIVKGKPTLSANLIAAAIRRHSDYDYEVKHLDDLKCAIRYYRNKQPIGDSTFTMDDARRAGLANGDNWRKYPRNMLFARAMSNGARWYCPDVFGGPVYTPDELGAAVDAEEGTVIQVSPEPVKVVRAKVTISREQQDELERLIRRKGADAAKLLSHYRVESLADLTPEQLDEAVGRLCGRPDVSQEPQCVGPVIETTSISD